VLYSCPFSFEQQNLTMSIVDKEGIEKGKQYVDWNELPSEIIANNIFPFVGSNQYRFVGGVCQIFEKTYRTSFSAETTINVTSVEHAKICLDEISFPMKRTLQDCLCTIAARNDNLALLKWARTKACPWKEIICAWVACNGRT
jgi:hypothetical protein